MDKENYSANLLNSEELRDSNEDLVEKSNKEHTAIIYDKRLYQDGQKVKAIGNVFLSVFFSFCKQTLLLELCSRCEPLTLIHGPPGTGKFCQIKNIKIN